MKYFLFTLVVTISVLFACSNGKDSHSQPDYDSPLVKDTIRMAEVDTFMMNLGKSLQTIPKPSTTPFEFNGEAREMSYYDLPDGTQRWDATVSADGAESYATCYLNKEELWMFRYRTWDTLNTKIVQDIYMYLKDEEIFFAIDRSTEPGSGMNPSHLMQMQFADSKKSKKELYAILNSCYPEMKEAWEKREE